MALDVYGLTRQRDIATLNRFLDEYVDPAANADRGDEELMLEPLDVFPEATEGPWWERWDWEPAQTLSHILERGLDYPRRAFTAYIECLPACHQMGIEQGILGFTRDNQLVLGLSVYSGREDADEELAHELLAHLAEAYGCHLGLILLEAPPPLSEAEFRQPSETLSVMLRASFEE